MRIAVPMAACLLVATAARAQPAVDAQLWQPPPGVTVGFGVPDARVSPHGEVTLGADLDHARAPLGLDCLRVDSCVPTDIPVTALRSTQGLSMTASAGLFDAFEWGLRLGAARVVSVNVERERDAPQRGVVPTDMGLAAKLGLLRSSALALSLWGELSLPTGNEVRYRGAHGTTLGGALLTTYRRGAFTLACAAGFWGRRSHSFGGLALGHELRLSIAADLQLFDSIAAFVDGHARLPVAVGGAGAAQRPVETTAGLRVTLAEQLQLRAGAGTGAFPNPDGYGATDYRVALGLRWGFGGAGCPRALAGGRACRPGDRDGDDVPDARDECPLHAEDHDGFLDADGCPDPDNDADGLVDAVDGCPTRSEDRDGYRDDDGCPEADNDADGVADAIDACPATPEDVDGFEDADGCPEPGPSRTGVTVTQSRILLSDRVYFEPGAEVLRAVSLPLLDAVAEAILALPADRHIRVEGHTDEVGSAEANEALSFRRARSVLEYLVRKGVPASRLSHAGFGGSRPLVKGSSPEARALNRRVEFRISRPDGATLLEKPAKIAD